MNEARLLARQATKNIVEIASPVFSLLPFGRQVAQGHDCNDNSILIYLFILFAGNKTKLRSWLIINLNLTKARFKFINVVL